MTTTTVVSEKWDAVVRSTHWLVAIGFVMNRFIDEPGETLHIWIGWTIAALVVVRLLWGLLPASGPAEIEAHLAALRQAGVAVEDLEIRKADLEDVFIQLMNAPAIATPPPTTTAGALS